MKKVLSALLVLIMVLSLFQMSAFAAGKATMTGNQFSEMGKCAGFVETIIYEDRSYYWKGQVFDYVLENAPEYVYYNKYDEELYPYCAVLPLDLLKTYTFKACSVPKGFYESYIEPRLEDFGSRWDESTQSYVPYETVGAFTEDGEAIRINYGYDNINKTFAVYDLAMGGPGGYAYDGFTDNGDGTYSFYYADTDWKYDEISGTDIEEKLDSGVSVTLKLQDGEIVYVGDERVDKLPKEYSEISLSDAIPIKANTAYKGTLASKKDVNYYKFSLDYYSTVKFSFNSPMKFYYIDVCDQKVMPLNGFVAYTEEGEQKQSGTFTAKLAKGKYYLAVYCPYGIPGDYDFTMTVAAQSFEVNYHSSNSAKAVSTKTKVIYGASTKTKTVAQLGFKKAGYSFAGWRAYRTVDKKWAAYKGSSKTVTWVALKDGKMPSGYTYATLKSGVSLSKTATSGKVHFYAQWKVVTYKITYKLNKGINSKKNPKIYKVTTSTIVLKKPTRKGYTFKGWYSDSKFKKKVTKIAKGSTGNKTLYAKWVKKK